MKKIFIVFVIIASVLTINAQNITNLAASLQDKKVILTYDLEAPMPTFMYKVDVYSSIDQYRQPLKGVSGEVGEKVISGKGKKIEWQTDKDIKEFIGEVDFKLKATLVFAPWLVMKPKEQESYKRGKSLPIAWSGYSSTAKTVRLELQKDGQPITSIDAVINSGKSDFNFPKNLKTGGGYQMKVVNTQNANEQAISKEFKIKRKIPLVVKLLPIAIIGGVAAAVIGGGSKDGGENVSPTPPENKETPSDVLPEPQTNPN